MKKLLITLTMLFAVINIMAQEHLSFKGIPIEGSMTDNIGDLVPPVAVFWYR